MVVQGANDPRVKKAESDQIVVALRDRHFPVEYLVAPDEGHGFQRPVNNMAMYAAIEKFLAGHLGGRVQESMAPDVATRLKEITVDPATVKVARAATTAPVAIPEVAHPIERQPASYDAAIAMGAQSMKMTTSNTVVEQPDGWLVTETATTPQGDIVDSSILAPGTLEVLTREVQQGPTSIHVTFGGGKATGTMSMQGQERPIDVDLGGPVFADGAGTYRSIATLPLKEGYSTRFRNFDVLKGRPGIKVATVSGVEDVTVPAGTFHAWKVEIASAEGDPGGQTVWIDQASRRVVKTTAILPQMGGATATTELVK